MIEAAFWACAAFVIYAYVGYPLALFLLVRIRQRPPRPCDITPGVSLIITARNEERRIRDKIENALALDYPPELLEIIVASDCSTDRTHAIVGEYALQGVRIVVAPERRGKEYSQGLAIAASTNEILVFSDVSTHIDRDGLRRVVANFADPTVGCVTSADKMIDADGAVSGEGAYVRYEMLLRSFETQLGSVVGLSGSFFAARRTVCQPWATDLPSDFMTLLNALKRGLRGVSEPRAIGYYRDLADGRQEYGRKVRTIVRGMSALMRNLEVLNPLRFGLTAWQLFSHKLCRWLVPFALVGLAVSNAWLVTASRFYAIVGVAQLAVYAAAAAGVLRREPPAGPWRIVTFLILANLSILNAWYDLARGRRFVTWEPSRR